MKTKQEIERKLKAFIISVYIDDETNIKSCVVIAYDKKEAGNIFVKWAKAKHVYERINGIVCQEVKKTSKNSHMISVEFYNKQNIYVDELTRKAQA